MKPFGRYICLGLLTLPLMLRAQGGMDADLLREDFARMIARVRDLEAQRAALQERYEKQQALVSGRAMREHLPGEPDSTLAWSYNDAGLLLLREGRLDVAGLLFERALAVLDATHAGDHPARGTVLQNWAEVLWQQRDPAAFVRFGEAEQIFAKLADGEHPRLGALLNSWAGAKAEAGDLAEAEGLYRRAIGVYEASTVPQDAVAPLHNLAVMFMRQDRADEAAALLGHARQLLVKAGEGKSLRMAYVLRAMSRNADMRGLPLDAAQLAALAQRVLEEAQR